jgi:hypothetical protein
MRRAFTLLALVALAACGDRSTGPSVKPIEGAYTLRTVNGEPLPYRQGGSFDVSIISGMIELGADGHYSDFYTMRWTLDSGVSYREDLLGGSGPWKRSGSTIQFQTGDYFRDYEGRYANDSLTVNRPGNVWVFTR